VTVRECVLGRQGVGKNRFGLCFGMVCYWVSCILFSPSMCQNKCEKGW